MARIRATFPKLTANGRVSEPQFPGCVASNDQFSSTSLCSRILNVRVVIKETRFEVARPQASERLYGPGQDGLNWLHSFDVAEALPDSLAMRAGRLSVQPQFASSLVNKKTI